MNVCLRELPVLMFLFFFVSPEEIRLIYKGGEEISLSSFAALKTALGDLSV